jgi:hypothetical protein
LIFISSSTIERGLRTLHFLTGADRHVALSSLYMSSLANNTYTLLCVSCRRGLRSTSFVHLYFTSVAILDFRRTTVVRTHLDLIHSMRLRIAIVVHK